MKTLLIIGMIYFTFRFLARFFAPFLMKKMVSKMQQKAEEQFGNKHRENTIKDGETIIDKKPQQSQQGSKSVGEYVDFEEVD